VADEVIIEERWAFLAWIWIWIVIVIVMIDSSDGKQINRTRTIINLH